MGNGDVQVKTPEAIDNMFVSTDFAINPQTARICFVLLFFDNRSEVIISLCQIYRPHKSSYGYTYVSGSPNLMDLTATSAYLNQYRKQKTMAVKPEAVISHVL